MSKKIKRSVKIDPEDAIVVAPIEDWGYVIDACKTIMNTAELTEYSRRGWKRVIDNMQFWVDQSTLETEDVSQAG